METIIIDCFLVFSLTSLFVLKKKPHFLSPQKEYPHMLQILLSWWKMQFLFQHDLPQGRELGSSCLGATGAAPADCHKCVIYYIGDAGRSSGTGLVNEGRTMTCLGMGGPRNNWQLFTVINFSCLHLQSPLCPGKQVSDNSFLQLFPKYLYIFAVWSLDPSNLKYLLSDFAGKFRPALLQITLP